MKAEIERQFAKTLAEAATEEAAGLCGSDFFLSFSSIETLVVISFVLLTAKQLMTLGAIWKSYRLLAKGETYELSSRATEPLVIAIIPVFEEQQSIESALRYFLGIPYGSLELVVVTTEREGSPDLSDSTMEVLRKLSKRYSFTWLHCSDAHGTKADQINYAIPELQSLFPRWSPQDSFVAIYDVDSRPNPETFRTFAGMSARCPRIRAFQQSALFDLPESAEQALHPLAWTFFKASAVRANRFVFGYEIPRLLNRLAYQNGKPSPANRIGAITYAHCVGHGLFLRGDLLEALPFPPRSVLEDMFYGFLLNYLHEPVVPIPMLDRADVPVRLSTLFFQMSRWFLGPSRSLGYFSYARSALSHVRPRHQHYVLVICGWWYAVNWALTTPVIAISLVGATLAIAGPLRFEVMALSVNAHVAASVFLLAYLTTVIATLLLDSLAHKWASSHGSASRLFWWQALGVAAMYPLVLLFHSLPAYHCLYDRIFNGGLVSGVTKTEHQ